MKIKRFNDINENYLPVHLQDNLDEYVSGIDKWMYEHEDSVNEFYDKISDLKNIIVEYNNWFDNNKEEIGQSEIDITLGNITGLNALNRIRKEDLSNLLEILNKITNNYEN